MDLEGNRRSFVTEFVLLFIEQLFSCTPNWLQVFHNSKWLLTVLGISSFIQSLVVNSIFPVGLSTLERRFHMTSTQTGIISSWYDFAILLAVFPVCHWGNSGMCLVLSILHISTQLIESTAFESLDLNDIL